VPASPRRADARGRWGDLPGGGRLPAAHRPARAGNGPHPWLRATAGTGELRGLHRGRAPPAARWRRVDRPPRAWRPRRKALRAGRSAAVAGGDQKLNDTEKSRLRVVSDSSPAKVGMPVPPPPSGARSSGAVPCSQPRPRERASFPIWKEPPTRTPKRFTFRKTLVPVSTGELSA